MPVAVIDGGSCFYEDLGSGFPVLFGHSYLWSSQMWMPQLLSLSKQFRCIAPDLWSHGNSDPLFPEDISIEGLARHAWKLMESLGISKFAVVGLSVGGMWATELAFEHPDAVTAVALLDTFVGSEPQATKQKYFALLDFLESEKRFTAPLLNQVVPLFFSPHTASHNPKLIDGFRESLAAIKEINIPGVVALGRAIFSRNCSLNKLSRLVQPVFVLVGRDDIPRPPREAEEMASQAANGELHVIERAGHISNLEQPEAVTALLQNFLLNCAALVK